MCLACSCSVIICDGCAQRALPIPDNLATRDLAADDLAPSFDGTIADLVEHVDLETTSDLSATIDLSALPDLAPLPDLSPPQFSLTVSTSAVGSGEGQLSSTPAGIQCSDPDCTSSVTYVSGSTVILMSNRGPCTLATWGGDCDGVGPTCTLSMTANHRVTVTYTGYNCMFVTAAEYPATLGGLAGADAICAQSAQAAGLPGTYRAWLSTTTIDAVTRFAGSRGWIRPDGRPFADTLGGFPLFAFPTMYHPPRITEYGVDIAYSSAVVWTATHGSGRYAYPGSSQTCDDWTSTSGVTLTGLATNTVSNWTAEVPTTPCSTMNRLYCFGTDYSVPMVFPRAQGRIAFLSDSNWDPSTGEGAADDLCGSEARAAGLSGSFLALLATSTTSAASRFNFQVGTLPWVRVDGVPVVASAADLFKSSPLLETSINVSASGKYSAAVIAWTGAATTTSVTMGNNNCSDWSTGMAGATAGEPTSTSSAFFSFGPVVCWQPDTLGIYCLEE
jgi:hypothetical protein